MMPYAILRDGKRVAVKRDWNAARKYINAHRRIRAEVWRIVKVKAQTDWHMSKDGVA